MRRSIICFLALAVSSPALALDCSKVSPEKYGRRIYTPNHILEAISGKMDGGPIYVVRDAIGASPIETSYQTEPQGFEWRSVTESDLQRFACYRK